MRSPFTAGTPGLPLTPAGEDDLDVLYSLTTAPPGKPDITQPVLKLLSTSNRLEAQQIARSIGVGEGTVAKHLQRLLHAGRVQRAARAGRYKRGRRSDVYSASR